MNLPKKITRHGASQWLEKGAWQRLVVNVGNKEMSNAIHQWARHAFLMTLWLGYRRGNGSAILNHGPGEVSLRTKARVISAVWRCRRVYPSQGQWCRGLWTVSAIRKGSERSLGALNFGPIWWSCQGELWLDVISCLIRWWRNQVIPFRIKFKTIGKSSLSSWV